MVQRHLFPQGPALSRKKNVVFIMGFATKMAFSMLCAKTVK